MSGRKNLFVTLGLAAATALLASSLSVLLLTFHYGRLQFHLVDAVCGEVVEQEPDARKIISAALKEYTGGNADGTAQAGLLSSLGYQPRDFSGPTYSQGLWCIGAGFLTGGLLLACTWAYRNRQESLRIRALAEYLEQADSGTAPILPASQKAVSGEDDFSRLEDEIYKTVTFLYQTKEAAVQARNGFAENLSNIAHQIKTPITAISLSVQMMGRDLAAIASCLREAAAPPISAADALGRYPEQIGKQLQRLTRLEEALLLLSRIDAGTLILEKEEVDVFTLLVLAADNLQELLAEAGASVDIPEQGGMMVTANLDWTMEAVMNLMKNCLEHGGGGKLHCSYAQNPLYTEILIWDEGPGFAKEDIPHLFQRFYRGRNAAKDGMGIGLALAKEIIERQNGTLRARNEPGGGALFEIRLYSH